MNKFVVLGLSIAVLSTSASASIAVPMDQGITYDGIQAAMQSCIMGGAGMGSLATQLIAQLKQFITTATFRKISSLILSQSRQPGMKIRFNSWGVLMSRTAIF